MLEVKLTVNVPDLADAINNLATALGGKTITPQSAPQAQAPAQPTPITPMPQPTPPVAPAPPVQQTPTNVPAPSVPLAAPPQYTTEQIMQAGATLMDAGKINDLLALLHSFGVQAVTDLKQEQLGAFATAMRELGAKI